MLIALMIVARAAGDWVEISQQHYRKLIRNHYNSPGDTEVHFEESTMRSNMVYDNHSLTELVWKGSVNKVPKLGSVQRVQLDSNLVKAPSIGGANISNTYNQNYHDLRDPSDSDEDQIHFGSSFQTSVERFQNDRSSNYFGEFGKTRYRNTTQNTKVNSEHENTYIETGFRTKSANKHEESQSFTIPRRNIPEDIKKGFVIEKIDKDVFNIDPFNKYDTSTDAYSTSSVVEVFTGTRRRQDESNTNRHTSPISFDRNKINGFPKKGDSIKSNVQFVSKSDYSNMNEDEKSQIPKNPFKTNENQFQNGNLDENEGMESSIDEGNTVETLIKFMKVVADTIRKNTRRSVSSKTRYLRDLKDTILANIEERIESLWPDDTPTKGRRRRAAEARGHLEVPSSESALMTISFLTFAVFLIKLVLQVIQTYKNKSMMVAPTVVAAVGRLAAIKKL